MDKHHIAIIGSGPTAIYLLKHISENLDFFEPRIQSVSIFEKSETAGMGMPYNPQTTDLYHVANITSEEIPMLKSSFADWLSAQPMQSLKALNITEFPIQESKVYSRISLGYYFHSQYQLIISDLKRSGVIVIEYLNTEAVDIVPKKENKISVIDHNSESYLFSKAIVATGHIWPEEDKPAHGYYSSPWPIQKLFPKLGEYYNFTIGILGASLSAFDVVTSLAHRHGTFIDTSQGLEFQLHKHAKNFKIMLHSAEGWLPHLQYEQNKPIREIYRHTTRKEILSLIDDDGFLPFHSFFDVVCRPALLQAFKTDGDDILVKHLSDLDYSVKDFIHEMESKHEYSNSFDGMKTELERARKAAKQSKPVHWMETLDDLMYCLNFHSELLGAEDQILLRTAIMPFLMNVIAALPLSSASILLALYNAGCLSMIDGKVDVLDSQTSPGSTQITVTDAASKIKNLTYTLFVNCSGQGKLNFEDYPFKSLKDAGIIRKARAKFKKTPLKSEILKQAPNIAINNNDALFFTGGIDVDAGYCVINQDDQPDPRVHDISFVHTAGCRPYSYGLQACNATSLILVEEWKKSVKGNTAIHSSIEATTNTYKSHKDL